LSLREPTVLDDTFILMSLLPAAEFETAFFQRLSTFGYAPKVIYDVGAAKGTWSRMTARIFPAASFHLFEPLLDHFDGYRAPMDKVLELHPQFKLHEIALGNVTSRQVIHMTPDGVSSSLHAMRGADIKRVEVPCWRLDEYVATHKLPPADVIKVDSQGAEALILEGGGDLIDSADVLFLETWLRRGYGPDTPLLTELSPALKSRGFILVEIGNPYHAEWHSLTSVDAFFLSERMLKQIEVPSNGWRW
jgi:FkbM family methyltransferase